MDSITIAAFITSAVSAFIGIFAIWLSVTFFKMSSKLSESTKEAASHIGASVVRLEKIFDRLYNDIFSITKDTVSDMRKQLWRASMHSEVEEQAEKKG
jgi:hypothetical protein